MLGELFRALRVGLKALGQDADGWRVLAERSGWRQVPSHNRGQGAEEPAQKQDGAPRRARGIVGRGVTLPQSLDPH